MMMYQQEEDEATNDNNNNNNKNSNATATINAFRPIEKKYRQPAVTTKSGYQKLPKHLQPKTDFSDVIDFHNLANNTECNRAIIEDVTEDKLRKNNNNNDSDLDTRCRSFQPVSQWRIYTIHGYPGFYFIPCPFTPEQQLFWIRQCLEVYAEPPNTTSLNQFNDGRPVHGIWQKLVEEMKMMTAEEQVENNNNNNNNKFKSKKKLNNNNNNSDQQQQQQQKLLKKFKWATAGYQYQWTERKYSEEFKEDFPAELGDLVCSIANIVGYAPYVPQAATINFYSSDMVMGSHLDNAEYEMEKPIISLSFGSTAVFLLGGETRDITPHAMFIRSGDIVVMGGRARYCYHGVARIIEDSVPEYLHPDRVPAEYALHAKYIQTRRININTRQVFKLSPAEDAFTASAAAAATTSCAHRDDDDDDCVVNDVAISNAEHEERKQEQS